MRASLPRWALFAVLAGCATAPAAAPDRYSPAEMKQGPSLYETGHIAVVPPSSAGLRIEDGAIDRPAPGAAVSAPGRARSRRLSSRRARPRTEAAPAR